MQLRTSQNRRRKAACLKDKWEKCCEKCGKDGVTCSIQHHDAHCSRLTKQAGQVLVRFGEVHPGGCLGTTLGEVFHGVSHWLVAKKRDHASKILQVGYCLILEPHSYYYHRIQGPLALF